MTYTTERSSIARFAANIAANGRFIPHYKVDLNTIAADLCDDSLSKPAAWANKVRNKKTLNGLVADSVAAYVYQLALAQNEAAADEFFEALCLNDDVPAIHNLLAVLQRIQGIPMRSQIRFDVVMAAWCDFARTRAAANDDNQIAQAV